MCFQLHRFLTLAIFALSINVIAVFRVEAQPSITAPKSEYFAAFSDLERQGMFLKLPEVQQLLFDTRQELSMIAQMKWEGDQAESKKAISEVNQEFYKASLALAPEFHSAVTFNAIVKQAAIYTRIKRSLNFIDIFYDSRNANSMQLTEVQMNKLDDLRPKLTKKIEQSFASVNDELESMLEDHYFELRDILTEEQWDTYRDVYGMPCFFKDEIRLFDYFRLQPIYSADIQRKFGKFYEIAEEDYENRFENPDFSTHLLPLILLQDLNYGFSEESINRVMAAVLKDNVFGFNGDIDSRDKKRITSLLQKTMTYPSSLQDNLSDKELKLLNNYELQFMLRDTMTFGFKSPMLEEHLGLNAEQLQELNELKEGILTDTKDLIAKYRAEFEGLVNELHEVYYKIFTREQKRAFDAVFKDQNFASELFLRLTKT